MLETRHWSDERLCRMIDRFHAAGPTQHELAGVYDALERTLGSDLHEMFAEPNSGVRALPQPPPAMPPDAQHEDEARAASSSEPIEDVRFWSNPTVSRALAGFSMAAVLALLWTQLEGTETQLAIAPQAFDVPQPFDVRSGEQRSSAPAPEPAALEHPSAAPPAAPVLRTADTESARKPPARTRVATAASARTHTNSAETGGKLNINSIPLSKVVLDGRPLGATPRVEVTVAAGAHTVLFVHPEHGRIQKEVYVDSGRTVLAAVRFD
jgi:hypothetical protein